MVYASFAILTTLGSSKNRYGDNVPISHPPIAFYHHLPEEYYRQGCALCEEELTPSDEAMLLMSEVSDLPNIVAKRQTAATVSTMLEGQSIIGMAHNQCIIADRWAPRTLIAYFPFLQQALPYYKYVTQLFPFDSYADLGYVCIESEQRQILLRTRERWIRGQALSFNDPPTWIHCTLIAAVVSARRRIPMWNIRVPERSNSNTEYINEVKRCMLSSQAWDDSMTTVKFSGPLCVLTEYPIIDYTRIK